PFTTTRAAPRTLYRPTSSRPSPRISRTCTESRGGSCPETRSAIPTRSGPCGSRLNSADSRESGSGNSAFCPSAGTSFFGSPFFVGGGPRNAAAGAAMGETRNPSGTAVKTAPAGRGGRDERRPELAPGRRALDGHHLGHAVTAGMTPPEMARDVGVPPPDLLGRQPCQQIHLVPDGTAAEERAHALGTGRWLARGH